MQHIASGHPEVENATATALAGERASWLRVVVTAIVPVTLAFVVEMLFWSHDIRWSLFYLAIFISSWWGGFRSGMMSTVLSTSLMWWFFTPPRYHLLKENPRNYLAALAFLLIGLTISGLHRRLRRRTSELAAALLDSRALAKQLEEALRDLKQSQRFLQAILDHSPNGIVIKSLDGRYLVINKGLESLTGVTASDSLGKTDFDLFAHDVAERFRANDKRVLETRAPLVTEERPGRPDGHVMLVSKFPLRDEDDDIFAICAIWTDITQRKEAEEALRQSTRDLRTAQRVAHVGSWRWDRRTGTNYWSEELYHIFGQDPRRPPPRLLHPDSHLFSPETTVQLSAAVHKLFDTGEPIELDLEVMRPDGSRRWVSAHGEAVRDDAGNIIGMDGTAADVTHFKVLQRMREEWTSVIAHDLRQPLGVITMAASFLPTLHEGGITAKERDFMERIRSATNTLARMVDDLLDMSLLEANRLKLECKWVDPATVVTEAVDRTIQTSGTKRVRVSSPRNLPQIWVDPMRIGQVLGNLLSNALKYGDKDHDVVVRLDQCDSEIRVSITNHGKGIEATELPRLFDRFARSRSTRGSGVPGLGLGLYISKGVVEAHGGRLWADSVPGKTTTFNFALPIATATREAA